MRLITTFALLAALGATNAAAAPSPGVPCRPIGSRTLSFDAVPEPVRLAFLRSLAPRVPTERLGGMAGLMIARRDAPWQATDVASPGAAVPWRRFIAADERRGTWRIWYETGGVSHLYNLAVLDQNEGGWRLARTLTEGSPAALCKAAGEAG